MKPSSLFLTLSLVLFAGACTQERSEPLPDFSSLWDFAHPDSTEARFRGLLPLAESSGDVTYHAELLTQIARTKGLRGMFAEGHALLDTVALLLDHAGPRARVRYLLERGRTLNSSGHPDSSKPLFLEAYDVARDAQEDGLAIDAAHMMGIVEPPEKQVEWSLKAMDLAERTKDEKAKGWLGPLYNNLGWSYHDMGDYEKALELFQKGLEWRTERGDVPGSLIAQWTVGLAHRSLGNVDLALGLQHGLLARYEAEERDPSGYVFEELGELYLLKGDRSKALPYFKQAWELLAGEEWIAQSEPERYRRLRELAEEAGERQ
jgi:tetratricopeptide (TPR) repeat protein